MLKRELSSMGSTADSLKDREAAWRLHEKVDAPLLVLPGNHDVGESGVSLWMDISVRSDRVACFTRTWGPDRFFPLDTAPAAEFLASVLRSPTRCRGVLAPCGPGRESAHDLSSLYSIPESMAGITDHAVRRVRQSSFIVNFDLYPVRIFEIDSIVARGIIRVCLSATIQCFNLTWLQKVINERINHVGRANLESYVT
jgi:hypothetical protein